MGPPPFFISRSVSGTGTMGQRTPLYDVHAAPARAWSISAGWDMPVNYGSQIEEHHSVRRDAGMFDVSHMCVVDLRGVRVREYLRRLLANDVAKLVLPGKALLVHAARARRRDRRPDRLLLDEQWFRMVVNAGTRDKDLEWLRATPVTTGVGRGRASTSP